VSPTPNRQWLHVVNQNNHFSVNSLSSSTFQLPSFVSQAGNGTILIENHLILEDDTGQAKLVSGVALVQLFKLFADKIECVLLNGCYSEAQAEAIHRHVDCVIGINQEVWDRASITFAVSFYDALGAGRSFEEAYEFGCNALQFENIAEHLMPVLKTRLGTQDPYIQQSVQTGHSVLLLVDGYNIIGSWPKLKKMRDRDGLEVARRRG
jgi:YacP-like NYN domain